MSTWIDRLLTHRKAWARLALPCAALSVLLATPGRAEERQTLRGHVPPVVARLVPVGRLPASQHMNLAIGLPLRNQEALTNLLDQLSDPASPNFRRYLTPQQFTEQFGPSEQDYQAVMAFARANGLTVTTKHSNRVLLDVSGSVGDIEKALHVTLRVYQHPKEARTFYACDVEPSLDLATPILTISGLNNYQLPRPNYHLPPPLIRPNGVTPGAGSGPAGNYMGRDFRAAYVPGTQLTGAGEMVGLLQFDGYFTNDIVAYENLAGLPNVTLENVYVGGANGIPGPNNLEVCLDIEMVISMAPGVSKVIVYEAPPSGVFADDLLNAMANENRARQLSASWSWGGGPSATTDQILQQMIAQGQTFFHCTMDADAYPPGAVDNPNLTFAPCDSPFATQVGGTTLTTSGPEGAWLSEKVWNWGGGAGSSGGISVFYPIPSWQQGINMSANQGSTTMRNVPDVALTADNVFVIADGGTNYTGVGGTSAASPLWAGFTALVNQQAAAASLPPVGFLNPIVYRIGKGPAFANCFHDTIVGDNTWFGSPNLFFAVPGYDLCTGWGTPTGTNLINALISPVMLPSLVVVSNFLFGGNGNGIIDFNECNSLDIMLANVGNASATGVKATLSTSTPEVAIAQPVSPYPDLPMNTSATNPVPFKISTSGSFVCGTPIDFLLLLECDQTVTVYPFSLPTGVPGNPFRFDNNSPVVIPSPGTISSSNLVSNLNFAVDKVTVSMYVTESFDYFLTLELVAPDGTSNILSANNGIGQNYGFGCSPDSERTTFDDSATTPIAFGSAPFLGAFQPTQPLSIFVGKSGTNVNGLWQLRATDQAQFDIGAIQCWSLFITPTLCVDGGGECPGADLALGMTARPQPIIAGNNLTYSISVTNNGPSTATNVTVTHLLPGGALFVSASPSQGTYAESAGVVTFNLGRMGPRATATLTDTVLPTAAGKVFSTATMSSEQPDFSPGNNSVTLETQISPATADLAVAMAAAPSPALVGSPLTYTISLTNNGPSRASGITVTNVLPARATILSATGPSGSFTTVGHTNFWNLSGLSVGGSARATIAVTPNFEETVTATATVAAAQFDPITANNTATVNTVVGAAADLAIGIIPESPSAVVTGDYVTNVIAVTNRGRSDATGVIVSTLLLPATVNIVTNNATQGTVTNSGNALTWYVGALSNGFNASLTNVVKTTSNGTNSTTATVLAAQPDPNPTNNTATATTIVAEKFVEIDRAGAFLSNGAIDLGQTATVLFYLRNVGNIPTRNLVATLLATNGVVPSLNNYTQNFGILLPSGDRAGSNFTFTISGASGGTISPTLHLEDRVIPYETNVSYTFTLPTTQVFANTNTILIPDPAAPDPPYAAGSGPALPYPSVINVPNFMGALGKVTVTLSNLNHSYPSDVNVLLVAPGGAKTLVMSHAGDQPQSTAGLNLTFDDSATNSLPETGTLATGVWHPTAYTNVFEPAPTFPAHAPAGPYATSLSALNSVNPNGAWSLYVFDDGSGDIGAISNGWSLALTTITPVNLLADLGLTGAATPDPSLAGGTLAYTFTITNGGPNPAMSVAFTNVLPAGVTLVPAGAAPGNVFTTNLGTLNVGDTVTVTNVVTVTTAAIPQGVTNGTITSVANVAAVENYLHAGHSTVFAVSSTVNRRVADLGVTQTLAPNPVVVGFKLTNTVIITNNGPQTAISVFLTDSLPTNTTLVSASGSYANSGGTVIWSLGDLAANASTNVTAVLIPWAPSVTNFVYTNAGPVTNISTVYTNATPPWYINATNILDLTNTVYVSSGSDDPVGTNDTATTSVRVNNPGPWISGEGTGLTDESFIPRNGAIDPGETVTVSFLLANAGTVNSTNVLATLLTNDFVISSHSGPQNYGILSFADGGAGPAVSRSFTFTASAVPGVLPVVTLHVQDAANYSTNVDFFFSQPSAPPYTSGWANTNLITIHELGAATPYPSTITVANMGGVVTNARVTLNGLTHSSPTNVSVLLVSPGGSNVMVMSHAGGSHSVTNLTLTFDAAAANTLSSSNALSSGTYQPSSYGTVVFPGPAPGGSYGTNMAAVNGHDPNGTWSLYVYDNAAGGAGAITNGWSLDLTIDLSNPAAITIPDHGVATPYPSTINVQGLTGRVSTATVTLKGLTHSFPHDVNVLLVSPSGSNVLVMSHTGGPYGVTNLNLVFDDAATNSLPNDNLITYGTYKPSSYEGPWALPGTTNSLYQFALSGMKWSNPNGVWSLYVFDDKVGDLGSIANGWSLNLSTVVPVGHVVDLAVGLTVPVSLNVGSPLTNTIHITNLGPDTATGVVLVNTFPAARAQFVSASQGSLTGDGLVTCNLGNLAAGGSANVTIVTLPSNEGLLTNWVSVTANEEDLNPANNTDQATTTVSARMPASLSGAFSGGYFHLTVTGQPNVVYVIQASTNLTSWVSLSTTSSTTGTFTFIDTTTPAPEQRFYRTLRP